jgi:hypothetical protein
MKLKGNKNHQKKRHGKPNNVVDDETCDATKKGTTHGTRNITIGSNSCYQGKKWV